MCRRRLPAPRVLRLHSNLAGGDGGKRRTHCAPPRVLSPDRAVRPSPSLCTGRSSVRCTLGACTWCLRFPGAPRHKRRRPCRAVRRERRKRGTAGVQREQELARKALDRRVDAAASAIDHSRAQSVLITELRAQLRSRSANERTACVERLEAHVGELEVALGRAQEALTGPCFHELSESIADTDSYIGSPPVDRMLDV